MVKNIYFLRHGETDSNKNWIIQGSGIDSPLNPTGLEQAKQVQNIFQSRNILFNSVYSSPLKRTLQTVEIITKEMPIQIQFDDTLKEIHCGDWEGKSLKEVDPVKLDKLRNDPFEKYPSGESCFDVMERSKKFINKIHSTKQENILVVSHGNFIRCITTVLLELPPEFCLKIFLKNCSITHLSLMGGKYKLVV